MSVEAEMAVTDSLGTGLVNDAKSGAVIPVPRRTGRATCLEGKR